MRPPFRNTGATLSERGRVALAAVLIVAAAIAVAVAALEPSDADGGRPIPSTETSR